MLLAQILAQGEMLDIRVIADDSMRGRATPSRGLELTACYVAAQFQAALDAPLTDLSQRRPALGTCAFNSNE